MNSKSISNLRLSREEKGKLLSIQERRFSEFFFQSDTREFVIDVLEGSKRWLNVGKLVTRIRETNVLIIRKNCFIRILRSTSTKREKCRLMRFCYYFYGLRYREGRFRTSFVDAGFPIATSLVRGPWTSIPEITLDARSDVWTPSNFATADFSAYI